jgi:alpha-glucan,water dikinase
MVKHPSPAQQLRKDVKQDLISYKYVHHFEREGQLAIAVSRENGQCHITLVTDVLGPLVLHWGVAKHSHVEWLLPPSFMHPGGTTVFQNKAAQTPFVDQGSYRRLHLDMRENEAPMGIAFVLKQLDTDRWLNDHGQNFYIPLAVPPEYESSLNDAQLGTVADKIIEREMSRNSWTLMHRFNLCYDLLDKVQDSVEGLALIFVWLRFSALRQLDWQRDYNTKPRELSHAMDRLTLKLADRYTAWTAEGEFIRLIMTALGRGGEGQRVRDEVLNIMHRHHIKEVSGHFMEEWHQKLHNNATPDDVVICEAYLEFLRSEGDLDLFYKTLEEAGVTKKRLKSYERPITSDPDFIPDLKEALINDFEEFLKVLKGVHSGTDLGAAIDAAAHTFDEEMSALMDIIWAHRDGQQMPVCTLAEKITEARRRVTEQLKGHSDVRDLLFLDLALEDFLRVAVERTFHTHLTKDELVDLVTRMLENLCLARDDEELAHCLHHWGRLLDMPRFEKEWSIHAKAVLERIERAMGAFIDRYQEMLQPKAEFLGTAFHADAWTVRLFSEEVVRGRPVMVLSVLLRLLDPILRKKADLGDWQVISSSRGTGRVEVVNTLRSIQGKRFARPTVVLADKVSGDEEIPKGVTAVITPDATDILSHVAVRARNAGLLFATCYDREVFEGLKSLSGQWLSLSLNAAGDVLFEEAGRETDAAPQTVSSVTALRYRPSFTTYAVSAGNFSESNVGGKSNNLKHLQGELPEWIGLPTSVALPFGTFEMVLAEDNNSEVAEHYHELVRQVEKDGEGIHLLHELRQAILALKAPGDLASSLHEVMEAAGLAWPANWEDAWTCIKRVWGSKWNERAYLSRGARGISHDDLFMAVLIQEMVQADYSFVIHSVDPFAGNAHELYAEVVVGLGETLVGNYPGRALSFKCKKGDCNPQVMTYPSKSVGLYGSGLIFRSDSNGEDLAGYAGAGIYDSAMLAPPRKVSLAYEEESLVWNEDFRNDFLATIALIGTVVEKVMGCPQDIEGSYCKGQYFVVQTRPQVGIESE